MNEPYTLVLASNPDAYCFPWVNRSRSLVAHPEDALAAPRGFLEQFAKIIMLNGIEARCLFHPRWTQPPRPDTYFFLWDPARCPLYAPGAEALESLKGLHKCYSFQEEDCADFGLRFNSTMYAPPPRGLYPERPEPVCDVFFLGVPKDRLPLLRSLHALLRGMGLRAFFRVGLTWLDRGEPEAAPGWLVTRAWMQYSDYLQLALRSRCLLDLYQAIQTGFSLRVMEHIFFGVKLLTNNRTLRKADFYHPNNIFFLGEDDMAGFHDWLELPFVPIDETIKEYYMFDRWAERFT